MNVKHWLLTAYVLAITTVFIFKQQRLEHPRTMLDLRLDEAKHLHDSIRTAQARATKDQFCATDFAFARDRQDTLDVLKGEGAIMHAQSGGCYIDDQKKARWRP